jgi:hypothetical protein
VSEQHEEEILRRWAREQAEIERQTDALVLKALTTLVTAAEDLKSKLRRDVEGILEEYRRTKRSLENEISLATAERQRFRREVEQERDTIVGEAESRARAIVDAAERECDTLVAEARTKEERLRTLEEQIRSVFGIEVSAESITPSPAPIEPEDADVEPAPIEPAPIQSASSTPAPPEPAPAASGFVPASPAVLTSRAAPPSDDFEDLVAEPSAALGTLTDDDEDAASGAAPTAPLPASPARPRPAARPAGPRQIELVFDGVPGYQQASALEMAVGDLLPGGEVDIVEFEHGQLVLSAQTTNLEGLADQLVSSMPASLQLTAVDGDRATFHCV